MKKYDKLTFVSRSDTCRGPMAEALFGKELVLEDIIADSRGMIVLFPEPLNPKAEEILKQEGLALEDFEARPLTKDIFDDRTLIMTMETEQCSRIREEYGTAAKNVYALTEYCGGSGDVESPLGKDLPEYRACFEQLKALVEKLAVIIKEEDEKL